MAEIFPISYWGSFYYFKEISKFDSVQLEAFEHFPKQTHRNRFSIVSANGELTLTAPVRKPNGTKTHTKDVELIIDKSTLQKNWRAVTSAYASSPFFDYYERELENLFLNPNPNLLQHCVDINSFLLSAWGIDLEFKTTESYNSENASKFLEIDFMVGTFDQRKYTQVLFKKDQEFIANMSALDLLCNLGPIGRNEILAKKP